MSGTFQLKGANLPSYRESKARTPRVEPFVVGRRYPIDPAKALAIIDRIANKLHEGELIDLSRRTRLFEETRWEFWTTEGRRVDAQVVSGEIVSATISERPDPDIPPRVR